jgi:plastocyanin
MLTLRSAATRGLIILPLLGGVAAAQPALAAPRTPVHHAATHHTYTVKEVKGKSTSGYVFYPAALTVAPGDTVVWVDDTKGVPHNIVGVGNKVINRVTVNGNSYSLTFRNVGAYKYQCQIHPGMVGVVRVQSPTITSTAAAHHTYTVKEVKGKSASGYVFAPAVLMIKVGDTVVWVDDSGQVPHNVVGVGNRVINRVAVNGNSYSLTFKKAGTYKYVCQVHPGMVGRITVK